MSSRPLPLRPPGMAAIAIFIFVFVWNDYLVGTVLATTEDMKTVQKGIVPIHHYRIRQLLDLFLASIIVAFIPVLAIFAAFQRWFIAGLTSGGVSDPDASRVSRLARLWNAPLYSTWEELLAVHGDAELAYVLVPHNAMREVCLALIAKRIPVR